MGKNNITTLGYFVKRLRDNGFNVSRVYDRYADSDKRKWTIVINPATDSVFITCNDNGEWPYKGFYHVDDGGELIPCNFYINTLSVEVVIKHLLEFKVAQLDQSRINNRNGRSRQKAEARAEEATPVD